MENEGKMNYKDYLKMIKEEDIKVDETFWVTGYSRGAQKRKAQINLKPTLVQISEISDFGEPIHEKYPSTKNLGMILTFPVNRNVNFFKKREEAVVCYNKGIEETISKIKTQISFLEKEINRLNEEKIK